MAGDGYKHRTAWAGAGNGVLAIDANGDGLITERNEIIFTDWDPIADGDLQALRNVFDTNQNGLLDSGDARWSSFRIMVTNADGTTTLKTLTELGIQSISLVADKTYVTLPDGSQVRGQATFTRTDGTTGSVADVSLRYDLDGHAVQRTVTQNADGSTTITNQMLNPDGSLDGRITGVTSSDGRSVTLSFDRDGDSIIDDVQTRVTVINANGSQTETLSNSTAAGRLLNRTITDTSADRKTITISRDSNGDTFNDQTETRITATDNSSSVVVSDLARNGSLISRSATTVSADGLTRSISLDFNGDGIADEKHSDATVVNAGGSRTQTMTMRNADNSLRTRSIKTLSADGRTHTVEVDLDGDGLDDLLQSSVVTLAGDGSSTSTLTDRSRDNSLRSKDTTTVSASGLIRQNSVDINGDGVDDVKVTDTTVVNADTSRTQTLETRNADNSLRIKEVITKGADGRSRTVQLDFDGDGLFDRVEVISVDGAGASVATASGYADNGSLISKLVSTTSASGLSRTDQYDVNGDAVFDTVVADVTVVNANGSATETVTTTNANGSLRNKIVETVSADGLSRTTQLDVDGNSVYDVTNSDVTVLAGDGSKTRTVTETNANGSLRSRQTTTVSSDRQSTTINSDTNGDGVVNQSMTVVTQSDGSIIATGSNLAANGTLISTAVETISATGLSRTAQQDFNGDGVYDQISSAVIVLNADGSRTTTAQQTNSNGSLRGKTVTTVNATGLSLTAQSDFNGDAVFDLTTTSVTVLNVNGSQTTTLTDINPNSSIRDRQITTISADGLSATVQNDLNGDGNIDITTSSVTQLNANGSRTQSVIETFGNGLLRSSLVSTISDDLQSSSSRIDADGDGYAELTEVVATLANGDVVVTRSRLASGGVLIDQIVKTVSATGLSLTEQLDIDGVGTVDITDSRITILNADGSRATTLSRLNRNGSLRGRTVVTSSATGLSETVQVDEDGNGVYEATVTDLTVLNTDGSITDTISTINANGTTRRRDIITVSDDGETVSISRDLNGNGVTDRTESRVTQTNGSIVDTRSNLSAAGALVSKVVETIGADGLSWTMQQDLNGDGINDRVHSRNTLLNVDGSRSTIFTDNAYSGAGGSVVALKSSLVVLSQKVTVTSRRESAREEIHVST